MAKDRTQKLLSTLKNKHRITGSGVPHSGSAEVPVLKKKVSDLEIENGQLKALMMQSKNPFYFVVLRLFTLIHKHIIFCLVIYFGMTTPRGVGAELLMLSFQP